MNLIQKIEINFSELMTRLLSLLSDKERDVIQRRFSLDGKQKETLDRIGKSYQITRERVRQIESVALKKLARISMDPSMRKIHNLAFHVLVSHGNIMSEDFLISEMLKNMNETKNLDVNAMKLAMKVSDQIVKQEKNQFFRAFWRTSETRLVEVKTCIKAIQSEMKKQKEVMTEEALTKLLQDKFTAEMIKSTLCVDWEFKQTEDGWGLTSWRHINPRSIKDKIMIIFKDIGKPMHFTDIVNHVLKSFSAKKVVTHQAIHNELIRHDDFVLVGRGVYALNEWGLPSGTVCDLIKTVLEENKEPMKRQDIINAVLEKREIRIGTISLNLQKYPFFKRVGRAVYEYDKEMDNRKRKNS